MSITSPIWCICWTISSAILLRSWEALFYGAKLVTEYEEKKDIFSLLLIGVHGTEKEEKKK